MQGGAIVQIGTPEEIVQKPANDYVRSFFYGVDVTRVFTAGDAARRNLVTVIERPGVGIRAAIDSLDEHDRDYGLVIDRDRHVLGMVTADRSEEHKSELQSLMRISYAVFCLK